MLVLKICINEWNNASRDKRELAVCRELGANVKVIAKGKIGDFGRIEYVDGYQVHRITSRPIRWLPVCINRLLSLFIWAHYARKLEPDVISGHDISGSIIAWLSVMLRNKKTKVVYDAHEFEIGRLNQKSRAIFYTNVFLERLILRRSVFSIVVNDSIADELVRIYKLSKRPVVVRNIPCYWEIDDDTCRRVRAEIEEQFKKRSEKIKRYDFSVEKSIETDDLHEGENDSDRSFIVMFHGNISPDRGVEKLIEVVRINHKIKAIILGNGDSKYIRFLKKKAEKLGVYDRILFLPAVKIEILWKYIGAVDVEIILAHAINKNYYYSLPNKFFESIQGGTPIICPDYPAMRYIVSQYNVGITCNPTSVWDINEKIEMLRKNKELYVTIKNNVLSAKEELCWEREKKDIKKAYKSIIHIND